MVVYCNVQAVNVCTTSKGTLWIPNTLTNKLLNKNVYFTKAKFSPYSIEQE